MPVRTPRFIAVPCATAGLVLALASTAAMAQAPMDAPTAPAESTVDNSDLDASLFYQLLIGELELRSG